MVRKSAANKAFTTWACRVADIEDVPSAQQWMTGPKTSKIDHLLGSQGYRCGGNLPP